VPNFLGLIYKLLRVFNKLIYTYYMTIEINIFVHDPFNVYWVVVHPYLVGQAQNELLCQYPIRKPTPILSLVSSSHP